MFGPVGPFYPSEWSAVVGYGALYDGATPMGGDFRPDGVAVEGFGPGLGFSAFRWGGGGISLGGLEVPEGVEDVEL